MNSYLVINTKAPFSGLVVRESQDLYLALSSFGKLVTLLFIGEGILQLLKDQKGQKILQEDINPIFKELDLYDIDNVYVSKDSLTRYGLVEEDFIIRPKLISAEDINVLIEKNDITFTF